MERYWETEHRDARFAQLDALIVAGWGNVPQRAIPANWRKKKPPKRYMEPDEPDVAPQQKRRSRLRADAERRFKKWKTRLVRLEKDRRRKRAEHRTQRRAA